METYGRIYRVVEPKRQRLNAAMATLKEKQDALSEAKAKLAEVRHFMEIVERIICLFYENLLSSWEVIVLELLHYCSKIEKKKKIALY